MPNISYSVKGKHWIFGRPVCQYQTPRERLPGHTPGKVPTYDSGGANHIQLTQANVCGAVYALELDDQYTALGMEPLVTGTPLTVAYGASAQSPNADAQNQCDVNGIANPDNLTVIPGYDTLIIAEDSSAGHQNDMIWAYHLTSGQLTRLQTSPYGAEITSPYFYPDINGFAYLMSVVQHPYGESDADMLLDASQRAAYTGYFVFPALNP